MDLPSPKRSRRTINIKSIVEVDDNDVVVNTEGSGSDEAPSSDAADDDNNNIAALAKRAWEHYRNYIDGAFGNDEEEDDDDEQAKAKEQQHEGDVDELLELIEIIVSSSSSSIRISPLVLSETVTATTSSSLTSSSSSAVPASSITSSENYYSNPLVLLLLTDNGGDDGGIADCLLPILLSMAYVHLANHAVSESFMTSPSSLATTSTATAAAATTTTSCNSNLGDSSSSSSSPEYYFQKALHYWPTNPLAMSLQANYHRMYHRSTTSDVCSMYVQASESAAFWRRVALEFLDEEEDEVGEDSENDERIGEADDEKKDLGDEDIINAKEWIELLVLNGALDVDYIGKDDDDDNDDDGDDDDKGGEGNRKDSNNCSKHNNNNEVVGEEDYSASGVEATASFMSAFMLSMLSKHDEALLHLQKFNLSHRIHPNVWSAAASNQEVAKLLPCSSSDPPSSLSSSSSLLFPPRIYGKVINDNGRGILPPELYNRLCTLFAPNAPYWKESNYDHRGYYSYFMHLNDDNHNGGDSVKDRPTNVIEDVIANHLLPLAEQALQQCASSNIELPSSRPPPRIVGAEWWTHTRPLGANLGHQIHFDTDESLLEREKRVTHPVISSVLYLTGAAARGGDCQGGYKNGAGSTIVFDQTPESTDVAPQAWIAHPQDNSFMAFPGNLLHGVLPCTGTRCGKGVDDDDDDDDDIDAATGHRLTFMVGFWTRNVTEGMDNNRELYTPCGKFPPPSEHSWVKQSQQGYGSCESTTRTEKQHQMKDENGEEYDVLPSVSPAWERIIRNKGGKNDVSLIIPKGLDHRFFVNNAPHCFSESLFEK